MELFALGAATGAFISWFITSLLWVQRLSKVRQEKRKLQHKLFNHRFTANGRNEMTNWQKHTDTDHPAGSALPATADMIESAAQRLVRWEDGCTWPDSWDALTVAAARQDAERALEAGIAASPSAPQVYNLKADLQLERYRRQKAAEALQAAMGAIDEALAAYARGKPVDEIMRELKEVQRDTV